MKKIVVILTCFAFIGTTFAGEEPEPKNDKGKEQIVEKIEIKQDFDFNFSETCSSSLPCEEDKDDEPQTPKGR